MKILLIEPHGDDAFLSCFPLLLSKNVDIDVLTLIGRESSQLKESESMSVINTHYCNLFKDNPDFIYKNLRTKSVHELKRLVKANLNLREALLNDILAFDPKFLEEFSYVDKALDYSKYDLIGLPVGLVHTQHLYTSHYCTVLLKDSNIFYYKDLPYAKSVSGNLIYTEFKTQLSDYVEVTPCKPKELAKVKHGLFKELYPTEVKLLRFSSEGCLEMPESFLVKKNIHDKFINLFDEVK